MTFEEQQCKNKQKKQNKNGLLELKTQFMKSHDGNVEMNTTMLQICKLKSLPENNWNLCTA